MTQLKQKEEERFYLQYFIESMKNLPFEYDDIKEQNNEKPDFLILQDNINLGIEVTQLFANNSNDGKPHQIKESNWDRILQLSKELWENNKNNPYIEVQINFNHNRITKQQHKIIAQEIVNTVEKFLPKQGEYCNIQEDLPDTILNMRIIRIPDYTENYWTFADSMWYGDLPIEKVQSRINEKNKKAKNYIKCSQLWLIIPIHQSRMSSICVVSDLVKNHTYTSVFDKTFLFEMPTKIITELNTTS